MKYVTIGIVCVGLVIASAIIGLWEVILPENNEEVENNGIIQTF